MWVIPRQFIEIFKSKLKLGILETLVHLSSKSWTIIYVSWEDSCIYEHDVLRKDINFFMNTLNAFRFDSAETAHFVRRIIYQLMAEGFALRCAALPEGIKN